jgi:hypothetical protein
MARALRAAGLETTVIELLDPTPHPSGTSEVVKRNCGKIGLFMARVS